MILRFLSTLNLPIVLEALGTDHSNTYGTLCRCTLNSYVVVTVTEGDLGQFPLMSFGCSRALIAAVAAFGLPGEAEI